jgi:ribosomal protein S18
MKIILPEKIESWMWAIITSFSVVILWYVFGSVLSLNNLDEKYIEEFKVLDKTSVLDYLGAVLAIQIPIFILFLQEMVKAGYVKRKTLPRITQFKEIILVLITATTLILISPRNSYLYFPLFILILVNLVAIFKAIQVTFHQEQYDSSIRKVLKNTAEKSFKAMMQNRRSSNQKYTEIENTNFIKYSFLKKEYDNTNSIPIVANVDGLFEDLDIKSIVSTLTREFKIENPRDKKKVRITETPVVLLRRMAGTSIVNADDVIAELVVPVSYDSPDKLKKRISKAFKINPKKITFPIVKYFDELLSEFKKVLQFSVINKDVTLLHESLEMLKHMLDALDKSILEDDNSHNEQYSLENAYKEFTSMVNDEFSRHHMMIYEMFTDLLLKAISENKQEISMEIIEFLYKQILNERLNPIVSSIARYDGALFYVAGQFVYPNLWNVSLSLAQSEIRHSIYFRIKEHTTMLMYYLRENSEDKESKRSLQEWFENRLSNLRGLVLAAIQNKKDDEFKLLLEILHDIDQEVEYDNLDRSNTILYRCNLFMIAAYLKHSKLISNSESNPIIEILSRWTDNELLEVLLECNNRKYADSWRVSTYDLVADGKVRSVPDYSLVMKELWADLMLSRPFNDELAAYDVKDELEQSLLFTESLSTDKDIKLIKYVESHNAENSEQLLKLIKQFMEVRWNYESTILASAHLDIERVSKFETLIRNAYTENSISYKLFTRSPQVLIDNSGKEKGFKEFGINQIFDKEAFIADWHSGYYIDNMAEQLGSQIAQGQDEFIFKNLLADFEAKKNQDALFNLLKKKFNSVNWLVISNDIRNYEIEPAFKKHLSKNSDYSNQYIKGIKQKLPIQHIFTDDLPKGIYFIDRSNIGTLTQKTPLNDPVDTQIDAYSHDEELMNGLLKTQPKWLKQKGNKAAQTKFLNSKVRMRVRLIFKYEKPKKSIIIFHPVNDDYR